ncbi:RNA-binding protein [Candidatus Woesearchaeota archaeon]|nr:RNA-binding protein [Candidatus Woesearchaeota archaeon]
MSSKILVQDKNVVVPGDILAEGMDYLPAVGTFREGERVIAAQVGVVNIDNRLIKVVALGGPYIPKRDDVVIGKVTDMSYSGWFIDIGYAYDASLSLKDGTTEFVERGSELSRFYDLGDFVITKITNVTRTKYIDLTMKSPGLKKLVGGKIISVVSSKIPRIVGKQGSMITMIKEQTGCQILAGQNGRIWISGKDPAKERLATEVIRFIEENAHTSGLTAKVEEFLKKHAKDKVE